MDNEYDLLDKQFTSEEYDEYCCQEPWELQGCSTPEDYEAEVAALVKQKYKNADSISKRWRTICRQTIKHVERAVTVDHTDYKSPLSEMVDTLPLLRNQVLELCSLLSTNPAIPTVNSPADQTDQYAAALNSLIHILLMSNRYPQLIPRLTYYALFYNLAVLNLTVDENGYGPFGQPRRIVMD